MAQHEHKFCPRCNADFECKVGNITDCQCNQIHLQYEERIYIESLFTDCLCIHCLQQLQQQYTVLRKKEFDF
jgi:hypothetical protein